MANGDEAGQRWAKELVERVGRAIKDARGGRSAAWLSDRTDELGYRVSPTVIAKLDSGHRGTVLSVAELIVLAEALDTSPVALMFGHALVDGEMEVLPNYRTSAIHAAQWFSGEGPLAMIDVSGRYSENNRALEDARKLEKLRQPLSTAAAHSDDPEIWEAWKRLVIERVREREAFEDRLRAAGLIVSDDDDA